MKFLIHSLVASVIVFSSTVTWSQTQCANLFAAPTVAEKVAALNLPVFQNTINGKAFPSILVNKNTYPQLQNILQKTLGIVVIHQTGHGNDHGMLRLGDFFIDRDLPGYRARGEINNTGISWASVADYVSYAQLTNLPYNRIEVLFDLSDAEYNTALAYQKMRRAGIVRPDFTFGTDTNDKLAPTRLAQGGEICFSFSCGSSTRSQIYEIQNNLRSLGVTDVDSFMQSAAVKAFLDKAKAKLLTANLTWELNADMMTTVPNADGVLQLMKIKDAAAKSVALDWVVGLSLTQDYQQLLQTLNVHNSSDFSNINNPRATGVLVYDANVNVADFLSIEYRSVGAFSTYAH